MTAIDTVFEKEIKTLITDEQLQKATSYTLADAIRGGSAVTEQLQGGWGNTGEACALTAAAIHIRAMQEK